MTTIIRCTFPARRDRLRARLWVWTFAQMLAIGLATGANQSAATASPNSDVAIGGSSEEVTQLGEVVVTAQKRRQLLQNVPISIGVLTGVQLDTETTQGVTDALDTLPGVATLKENSAGGTLVMIRGVSAGEALLNGAGTVAYYIDSMPFGLVKEAIAPDMDAYDLSRVEVLKGPQGTLYGANALNGVVRVLTNDADLNKFEAKARASGSSTDGADGNYRVDMALNVPLIPDKLAARAVVGYQDDSGWISTTFKHDYNDDQLRNLRLKINAQPTDALAIGVSVWNSREDYGGPAVGDTPRFSSTAFPEPIHNDYTTTGLKVGYEANGFSVSSETSYLDYTSHGNSDESPFGLPSVLETNFGSRVFSEEVRMLSSDQGAWRWLIGGMYRKATENLGQELPTIDFGLLYADESKSDAIYGELTRLLFDGKLELTAGLRYFHDDISQDDQTGTNAPVIPGSSTASATTPRAVVTWHPGKNMMIYASYSEGFRSGFPQNAPAAVLAPAEPDLLKNYEIGAKGTFLSGHLVSNLAVYHMDWQHVQENVTVAVNGVPFSGTINGQSASGQGVDLDITAAPTDHLTVSASYSWNNLHMDQNVYSDGVLLFPAGARLNFSAKYTASGAIGYTLPFGASGLSGHLSLEGHYVSSLDNTVLLGIVANTGRGDALFTSRVALSIASTSNWMATLFVDNLNNYQEAPVTNYGTFVQYFGRVRPRTAGLQLEYRY